MGTLVLYVIAIDAFLPVLIFIKREGTVGVISIVGHAAIPAPAFLAAGCVAVAGVGGCLNVSFAAVILFPMSAVICVPIRPGRAGVVGRVCLAVLHAAGLADCPICTGGRAARVLAVVEFFAIIRLGAVIVLALTPVVGGVACPSIAPTVSGRADQLSLRCPAPMASVGLDSRGRAGSRGCHGAVVPVMRINIILPVASGTLLPMVVFIFLLFHGMTTFIPRLQANGTSFPMFHGI